MVPPGVVQLNGSVFKFLMPSVFLTQASSFFSWNFLESDAFFTSIVGVNQGGSLNENCQYSHRCNSDTSEVHVVE